MNFQTTIKNRVSCAGIGLHTGARVNMTLAPAGADFGIQFRRTDVADRDQLIPAHYDLVAQTNYGTVLANRAGVEVATVEHVMAALAGLGVDNAMIELDGPEVPIMDGSAAPFVFLIECAGLKRLQRPRRVLQILDEIEIVDGDKRVALKPWSGFAIDFEIDFDAEAIGRQARRLEITQAGFKSEIARARTFGFLHELEQLNAHGLARGGSLDNAIVLNGGQVLNRGGLRYRDEFVRHKILDAIGDLALAGLPIIGAYSAHRAGHGLNNRLLRALFDTPMAYEIVTLGVSRAPVSPGLEAAVA